MNTTFKRSVAAFLTAGMLLTGLTACFKSPEEKSGDEITELANQESEIKFDEILYAGVTGKNSKTKIFSFVGYVKSNLNTDKSEYMELEYEISKEDYEKFLELAPDYELIYPFNTEATELIKELITKYDPSDKFEAEMNSSGYELLDQLVEEYCK